MSSADILGELRGKASPDWACDESSALDHALLLHETLRQRAGKQGPDS